MGILFTGVQGNILTTLMGNVLTEGMGKVLDIYTFEVSGFLIILRTFSFVIYFSFKIESDNIKFINQNISKIKLFKFS